MTGVDLGRVLDPGPLDGPTRAELQAAIERAGDPMADDFGRRVLAELRQYNAGQVINALGDLADAYPPTYVESPLPAAAPMWWECRPGGAVARVDGPGPGRVFSLDLAALPRGRGRR